MSVEIAQMGKKNCHWFLLLLCKHILDNHSEYHINGKTFLFSNNNFKFSNMHYQRKCKLISFN